MQTTHGMTTEYLQWTLLSLKKHVADNLPPNNVNKALSRNLQIRFLLAN